MALRVPHVDPNARRPLAVVGGLVALLLVAGLGIGGFFILRPEQEPATAARIAVEAFLSRLVAGDAGTAYEQLCVANRRQIERADFEVTVAGRPAVRSYEIGAVQQSGEIVSVAVTLVDPGGVTSEHVYEVRPDRGAWRLCGATLPAGPA